MSENIIPFPQKESAKVGFYELSNITLKFTNIFSQTIDPERQLSTRESINAVQQDVATIKDQISAALNEIDGLRPGMPTLSEFREQVWDVLCLPLAFGKDRASMSYYGTEQAQNELCSQYAKKQDELKRMMM